MLQELNRLTVKISNPKNYYEVPFNKTQVLRFTFIRISDKWKKISNLFHKAGETNEMQFINQASELLVEISERGKSTIGKLEIASG